MHDILNQHSNFGEHLNLVKQLFSYGDRFRWYFRIVPSTFHEIHGLIVEEATNNLYSSNPLSWSAGFSGQSQRCRFLERIPRYGNMHKTSREVMCGMSRSGHYLLFWRTVVVWKALLEFISVSVDFLSNQCGNRTGLNRPFPYYWRGILSLTLTSLVRGLKILHRASLPAVWTRRSCYDRMKCFLSPLN